ncbi:MAG: hypothetical protein IT453_11040 [Planctomycetes bacterium]|nr:hypothetical protein [Planctomycetota bacterium]
MKNLFLIALVCAPLGAGCAAVAAGAVGGIVMTTEFTDAATYVTHLNIDAKKVWPEAKNVLQDTTLELLEVDDAIRVAKAKIDGATVTVSVEPYDIDKSTLLIKARKYGFPDGETARLVQEKIVRRLQP